MQRETEYDTVPEDWLTQRLSPDEIARIEVENALEQYDFINGETDRALRAHEPFILRPSFIMKLNRIALKSINGLAGIYRPGDVSISNSSHRPPICELVPEYVEELCDYINDSGEISPIHCSAYALWRVNWIHPFVDGNGRTARALSYFILNIKVGHKLPGTNTVPEQIAANKAPYYQALEIGDTAAADDRVDVSAVEKLIEDCLAKQLAEILKIAGVVGEESESI